jgi:TctA family transporter
MHENYLHGYLDTLLIGIPFIAMLLIGVFRLDEIMVAPKKRAERRARSLSGIDHEGNIIFSDPDGKRWHGSKLR